VRVGVAFASEEGRGVPDELRRYGRYKIALSLDPGEDLVDERR